MEGLGHTLIARRTNNEMRLAIDNPRCFESGSVQELKPTPTHRRRRLRMDTRTIGLTTERLNEEIRAYDLTNPVPKAVAAVCREGGAARD
jgi:hypothetical protein